MSALAAQLRQTAASIGSNAPYSRHEAIQAITEAARRLEQLERPDPLARFAGWDGITPLGEKKDERPGYSGEISSDQRVIALNTGWVTSTRLGSGAPGVYMKLGVRVAGEDDHHVLDLVAHVEVAGALGQALYAAAERAPLDDAADRLWEGLQ